MDKRCYSQDHLWLEPDGSGGAAVGVTHYAQEELGDILFVELPEPGTELVQGQSFGVIESVKTASELIAPASGQVVAANEILREEPWQVNDSPEGEGWILKMNCTEANPCASLMDADSYEELTGK
ncbi:MAG: glycine cleavage system protein GcvH [Gammaproteobacteria bacterium]|nr:glycine cleavage system protein GcvH [Gammaproteobacteria bacterium]